jgi:coenzyme F420-dependent glucose-6-phosphate dehydrogenase
MEIGYWLSSEEHDSKTLVANAKRAEDAGFEHLVISDHYHPWVEAQGESPFVWGVIGAIAQATDRIRLGTGVTCPLIRMHPAIVAHAAATSQQLLDGRFFLGLGTGENLNEHILGDRWPRPDERLEMFEEAVEIIRKLLGGEYETYRGKHYTVEQARIYSLPETPPELILAAGAPDAAELAGRIGDGYMNVQPDGELVAKYKQAGGKGALYGKVTGVFASSVEEAKKIAKERAENSALGGSLSQELALPRDFEAAAETVREDDFEGKVVLGDDAAEWKKQIDAYRDAGFTHVALHNVAKEQEDFIAFAKDLGA